MSVIGFVLDDLPAFLLLWAITSSVMVAAYGTLTFATRTVAVLRRAGRPTDRIEHPYPPELYPECWMCEGAQAMSLQALIRHQLNVHGAIRW